MYLYASLTNCSDPADSPSDPLRKILAVKSTATAVNRVEFFFMSRSNHRFSPPAPLITNIRVGSFSDAPEKGGGISIFYFFNPSNSLSSKHDNSAMKRGACLKWHIGCRYNSKCPRSSSHGPLTPDLVTSVQKFAEKCRMLNK